VNDISAEDQAFRSWCRAQGSKYCNFTCLVL